MTVILEAAAGLCLLYYGGIVLSTGFSVSFSLFWPFCAALFGFLAAGRHYYLNHREEIPVWPLVSAVTVLGAAAAVIAVVLVLIGTGILTSTKKSMDYVIVLGAKVNGTEPSNSLKKRLDRAIDYAENNPNTFLVLSGGQGKDEEIAEAEVMYEYLRYNGVPETQLLLETRSTNTRENIRYSLEVIRSQEQWKERVFQQIFKEVGENAYAPGDELDSIHIGILTSDFHLFRAKAIAKKQGGRNVYGISAPSDPLLIPNLWLRECFAILKDKFMGNI